MGRLSSKTLGLVVAAIKNLKESKGSSSRDIFNYISSIYKIPEETAKRQVISSLKRGVAHGILRKSDGYYSLPTDTEAECMEVAAQELGLLDLCCRRKKRREARRKKSCKTAPSKRKRSMKSRRKCKPHGREGRSRSRKQRRGRSMKSKSGCGCKTGGSRKERAKRKKRSGKDRCKPSGKSKQEVDAPKRESDYFSPKIIARRESQRKVKKRQNEIRSRSLSRSSANRSIVQMA